MSITTRTTIVSNVQLDDNIGYDCWKRKGLSRRRKLESVGAETTSSGSPFQIRGPETLKLRLPTVDSRNIGTTRRLELAEQSARRPCRSADVSCSVIWDSRHYVALSLCLLIPALSSTLVALVKSVNFFTWGEVRLLKNYRPQI